MKKQYFYMIIKFITKIIIGSLIFVSLAYLVSNKFDINISDSLTYTGILSLVIGLFSVQGNRNMDSNPTYFQAESVSSDSMLDKTLNHFKAKGKNLKFLLYMIIISLIQFLIGYIFL